MSENIQSTRNTNDTATVTDVIEITVDTAVAVSVANERRIYFSIQVQTKGAYIRLIPAATGPNDRKGIRLINGQFYEMPVDNIYTGEISIINLKNNDKPKYSVTEY